MFEREATTSKFILPTILVLLGGTLIVRTDLGLVGWILVGFAFMISLYVIVRDVIREAADHTRESAYLVEDRIREMELIQSYNTSPEEELEDSMYPELPEDEYPIRYPINSISPLELRIVAQLCLVQNAPFSLRELTGANRPLTDTKFRRLKDELLSYNLIEYKDPRHPTVGFEWTDEGVKFLQDRIDS